MRNFIIAACAAFIGAFISGGAIAGGNCKGDACDAAHWATRAPAVNGPKAPTRQRMACVRVVSYGRTEVIWINGTQHNYVNAPVIARQRASGGHYYHFPLRNGWIVTESCIPQHMLDGIRHLTICNGDEPGEGYHWQISGTSLQRLKGRSGHPGTYLPLVSTRDRNSLTPAAVASAYRRHYGG